MVTVTIKIKLDVASADHEVLTSAVEEIHQYLSDGLDACSLENGEFEVVWGRK